MDFKLDDINDFEVIYLEIEKRGPNLKLLKILYENGLPPPLIEKKPELVLKFARHCDWWHSNDSSED